MKRLSVVAASVVLLVSSGAGAYDLGGLTGGGSTAGGGGVSAGMPAEPSCAQVICLSPQNGMPPPPSCIAVRAPYFAIRVFSPYYNSSATAQARRAFLMTCTTARPMDINTITNKYGELYSDPMVY
jgi:hypothetical protein